MFIVTKLPGQCSIVSLHEVRVISLEELQGFIGGDVELVRTHIEGNMYDIWCHEEGSFEGLESNFYHPELGYDIVGPVLVCSFNNEGEDIVISSEQDARSVAAWLDSEDTTESEKVTICAADFEIVLRRGGCNDTCSIESNLKDDHEDDDSPWNCAINALEALLLGHFAAGVDVEDEKYVKGLKDALVAIENHY